MKFLIIILTICFIVGSVISLVQYLANLRNNTLLAKGLLGLPDQKEKIYYNAILEIIESLDYCETKDDFIQMRKLFHNTLDNEKIVTGSFKNRIIRKNTK